jgi:hypothetical protein
MIKSIGRIGGRNLNMATSKLFLANNNNSFSFVRDKSKLIYTEEFSDQYVFTNGWECTIFNRKSGKPALVCEATREYSTGTASFSVFVDLSNGFYTIKVDNETKKKGYLVKKGEPIEGILGLPGGNIYDRYFYFRSNQFSEWLNAHKITAVESKDPNTTYCGWDCYHGCGTASFNIETDGDVEYEIRDCRDLGWATGVSGNSDLRENHVTATVTNATWCIVRSSNFVNNNHSVANVLYTKKKINELSLPKYE